jgi:5-methyltetrahydropteroyltriglutamate--homocysteine methyltransferase
MQRSTDRTLTTHTGSLPRPADLERTMLAHLEGRQVDAAELEQLVRQGVREVVSKQAECGVDVVSDGEVGKPSYSTYVSDRLDGFGGESGPMVISDLADYPEAAEVLMADPGFGHMVRPACVGPVALKDPDAVHRDIAALKAALEGVDVAAAFMTAVSPATISMFFENQHYPDQEAYLTALAEVMRHEYRAIVDAGLILQIDCPDLGCGHVLYADKPEEEVRSILPMHVEVLNHALRDLPADRVRMHVCWGNYQGPHHRDIALRDIVDTVLKVHADGLLLEAANPRHDHEWQVWEDVALPEGKVLIPGVVDTTNNYIEHPELVAQRIVRYAKVVGRENVVAGSDCGFGTLVGMRATAPTIAWAKLATMAEGAALATRQLW